MKSFFTFVFVVALTASFSQTKTWDGGGSNNNWHTTCNWNPDGVPACTDIVTIGTGNIVNIATGTIAHCEVLNLQGTADLNIQGTGKLEVSSNNSCVGTRSSTSTGCTVPSTSWSGNGGGTSLAGCFATSCICTPGCTYGESKCVTLAANNSSYNITVTHPPTVTSGCGNWSYFPASRVLTAGGGTLQICLTSPNGCCPQDFTHTFAWTSSDGGSGTFTVYVCNLL